MIKLDDKGLVPAIVQDDATGRVLTLAYMNEESIKRTIASGQVWFYSRSRKELWHKGATSGNYLNVKSLSIDCDGDAVLIRADPTGPACHTGEESCFFQTMPADNELEFDKKALPVLEELFQVIQQRKVEKPKGSYVAELLSEGRGRVGQKVIEEAGESAIAAVEGDREQITREIADLWFHSLVLLAACDLTPEDVWEELRSRRR